MTAADEAYDRLHGVDGHTQAVTPRYTSEDVERLRETGRAQMRDACLLSEDRRRRAEAAEAKLNLVRGLLAAYGDAEGTPVDYEFLVHHISEAIK